MKNVDGFHWTAEVTIPKSDENKWNRNINIEVICGTFERAAEIVREAEPTAVIHVIRKVGKFQGRMYVDEAVFDG